jgi:hypothetical protein
MFRVTGTIPDQFGFDLDVDPPLATVEILSLLFGDAATRRTPSWPAALADTGPSSSCSRRGPRSCS